MGVSAMRDDLQVLKRYDAEPFLQPFMNDCWFIVYHTAGQYESLFEHGPNCLPGLIRYPADLLTIPIHPHREWVLAAGLLPQRYARSRGYLGRHGGAPEIAVVNDG